MTPRPTAEERAEFFKRTEVTDTCWQWKGVKYKNGYGYFWFNGQRKRAHRFSYAAFVKPITSDECLDHLCRNRACVNPEHLEIVSSKENVLRGIGITAVNARKTHCVHGHDFTDENIYLQPGVAFRRCRTCRAMSDKARKLRRKGLPDAIRNGGKE